MDYKIRWSPEAVEDLEKIENYLKDNWSEIVLNRFKSSLSNRLKLLSRFPEMHIASPKMPALRKSVLSKETSIIYTLIDNVIYIVGLIDNRSDHDY
ncbi:Plasmid stabilization system protein ParE [Ekhidna lutea]|uniref:Plasmid stabilization system protein ParE n=1 Tax=Ekhidna lutea TaxID=447679 RepID=A0A239HAE3_EKHLU|nr:type II toxin-antitoxin system RelE/ParE family toxin [Ekhidna lutea]SNS78330.1 Plasmid stabilization system protein ParE [Ekhidna lutea]